MFARRWEKDLMKIFKLLGVAFFITLGTVAEAQNCPYDPRCLTSPYAGNPYKSDGLMNRYSPYGSPYSNKSPINPYATDAPQLFDNLGNYKGRLSNNPYAPDSTSNPYVQYGNPYSPNSINNRYGAGAGNSAPIRGMPSDD